MKLRWAAPLLFTLLASQSPAETADTLGVGRLFTNDVLGDGHDRWRSGSYVISVMRGSRAADRVAPVLEYRLRAEIISPSPGSAAPGDRPYVGALSAGLHAHFAQAGLEYSLGAELVATGPQTRLSALQEAYHEAFSLPQPPHVEDQIGNSLFLAGAAQVTGQMALAEQVTLRPFAEVQAGAEQILRVGGDLMIGQAGQGGGHWLRDVVTGQPYQGISAPGRGATYILGGDVAAVGESRYLPGGTGAEALPHRTRLRAGVHYQASDRVTLFYGLTWLSEEFEGQSEPQILGSLKLNFNF